MFRIKKKNGHYLPQEQMTILWFIKIWLAFLDARFDMPIEYDTEAQAEEFIQSVKEWREKADEDKTVKIIA